MKITTDTIGCDLGYGGWPKSMRIEYNNKDKMPYK